MVTRDSDNRLLIRVRVRDHGYGWVIATPTGGLPSPWTKVALDDGRVLDCNAKRVEVCP